MVYNFCFDHFSIRVHLDSLKTLSLRFSNRILALKMISNGKVINYKVVGLLMIYSFCFGHFSIQVHLDSSTNLNLRFSNRILVA